MAQPGDYLFLSIETLINTISIVILVPCLATLLRTQGLHGNCKVILVTSALLQMCILLVQCALFVYDYIIGNLQHDRAKEQVFLILQNGLFATSSCLSLVLVLERTFALWNSAQYEQTRCHLLPLFTSFGVSIMTAALIVYAIFWHGMMFETIIIFYAIECVTLVISIVIIFYSRAKYRYIPYDQDRLKAKYQVKEVLDFSLAILPSVIVSVIMHTLSLVPTMLWINNVIDYPQCCIIYFSVHSLNCIVTKLTLIACHKGLRERFQLLFVDRLSTPEGARIQRDGEQEGNTYFDQMNVAWNAVPANQGQGKTHRNGRVAPQ